MPTYSTSLHAVAELMYGKVVKNIGNMRLRKKLYYSAPHFMKPYLSAKFELTVIELHFFNQITKKTNMDNKIAFTLIQFWREVNLDGVHVSQC